MKEFFDAATKGNIEGLQKHLKAQQSEEKGLNQQDSTGRTALHHAVAAVGRRRDGRGYGIRDLARVRAAVVVAKRNP